MPNLYHCNSANHGLGILRAVLSREESSDLLRLFPVRFAGLQFPMMVESRTHDLAVLRIREDEGDIEWQIGFYSFDGDISEIEEGVQACTKSRPPC